jgi:hypothetical protein
MKIPLLYSEYKSRKRLNPLSKFIMIGNDIDGGVNFDMQEFENFEQVKLHLFEILTNLKFCGEWDIKLYQVDDNYKIQHLYGYYRKPKKGKLIFKYSYMYSPINKIIFEKKKIIIVTSDIDYYFNWIYNRRSPFDDVVFLEIYTINLLL